MDAPTTIVSTTILVIFGLAFSKFINWATSKKKSYETNNTSGDSNFWIIWIIAFIVLCLVFAVIIPKL